MNLLVFKNILPSLEIFLETNLRNVIPGVKFKAIKDPWPKLQWTLKLSPLEICFLKDPLVVLSFEGGGDDASTFWESHSLFQIQGRAPLPKKMRAWISIVRFVFLFRTIIKWMPGLVLIIRTAMQITAGCCEQNQGCNLGGVPWRTSRPFLLSERWRKPFIQVADIYWAPTVSPGP